MTMNAMSNITVLRACDVTDEQEAQTVEGQRGLISLIDFNRITLREALSRIQELRFDPRMPKALREELGPFLRSSLEAVDAIDSCVRKGLGR